MRYLLLFMTMLSLQACSKPTIPVIYFNKVINKESAAELIKTLENHNVGVLSLNSRGGSVEDAIKVSKVIAKQRIKVVVESDSVCSSACTYLFIASDQRELKGLLGIHAPAYKGKGYRDTTGYERKVLDNWKESLKMFVVKHGVKPSLIDRSFTIPNKTISYLNEQAFTKYLIKGEY